MGRIYIRNELDRDPRVLLLADLLGIDVLDVVARLWKLWSYADEHSHGGVLAMMTPSLLDKIVHCEHFAVTLEKVGWLVIAQDSVTIPRYSEHCGRSQKRRQRDKLRKRRQRGRTDDTSHDSPQPVPRDNVRTSRGNPPSSPALSSASASASTTPKKTETEARARPARRVPEDFDLTPDRLAWSLTEGLSETRVRGEFAKFRDHEFAKARTDWSAAWRNWVRRAREDGPPGSNGTRQLPPNDPAKVDEAIERYRRMGERRPTHA